MKRSVYRALLGLHPQRFRERFGEEMLCIFDESPPERDTRLFADCLFSLLRQWLLRSNLWKMASGAVISSLLLGAWGNSTARGGGPVAGSRKPVARSTGNKSVAWRPEDATRQGRIRARGGAGGGHPRQYPQDGSAKAARAAAQCAALRA